MALAMARFVSTVRGDGTDWPSATRSALQSYYDISRKTTPLVTRNTGNSGASTAFNSFTLGAPGIWEICANTEFSSVGTLKLCRNNTSTVMASSGAVLDANVTIIREFEVNALILTTWTNASAATLTDGDDMNFISFLYHGAF